MTTTPGSPTNPLDGLDRATSEQVGAVVRVLQDALHADLLAAWLHGSAVHGGLRPHSDVDVLAVVSRPTTAAERDRLISGLLPRSGRHAAGGPARSIELTIVVAGDVRPWRYPPSLEFQYGDWWRTEFERGNHAPWTSPDPDLAVVLTAARSAGVPLVGPAPAALLDPVPRRDLDQAMLDGIPGLLPDLGTDTANVVLTLARIWRTLATGEIQPKDVAAGWVLARLPGSQRAVLERARAVYLGEAEDRWEDLGDAPAAHAAEVVRRIHAAVRGRDATPA